MITVFVFWFRSRLMVKMSSADQRKGSKSELLTRLIGSHFPSYIPNKPGSKRSRPQRDCKACNATKAQRVGFIRKQTTFVVNSVVYFCVFLLLGSRNSSRVMMSELQNLTCKCMLIHVHIKVQLLFKFVFNIFFHIYYYINQTHKYQRNNLIQVLHIRNIFHLYLPVFLNTSLHNAKHGSVFQKLSSNLLNSIKTTQYT